jgi:hypothetical protein
VKNWFHGSYGSSGAFSPLSSLRGGGVVTLHPLRQQLQRREGERETRNKKLGVSFFV